MTELPARAPKLPGRPQPEPQGPWGRLALAYAALIVYGSLYPFTGWRPSSGGWLDFLAGGWLAQFHAADTLVNVLAYVPLGLLLARRLRRGRSLAAPILVATLAGASLSFAMEFLQQFLPSRVASLDDIVTNSAGTLTGAILGALVHLDTLPVAILVHRRNRWFRPGRLMNLGLAAIALWALSQTMPFVPSFDIGEVRHGLAPMWQTLQHPARFDSGQWAAYALDIAGLALLARTLANPGTRIATGFFGFVACLLLYKALVVSRQLSLEALAGAASAAIIALPLLSLRSKAIAWTSAALILAGFCVDELRADPASITYPFTWIPFSAQMQHPLIGIGSILENLWPATALAYLARFATEPHSRVRMAIVGGGLLGIIAFALEWHQQLLPGRVGDITTVLLMVGAWGLLWAIRADHPRADPAPASASAPIHGAPEARAATLSSAAPDLTARSARRRRRKSHRWIVAFALGAAAVVAVFGVAFSRHPAEVRVDESKLPKLPAPEQLPQVALPRFKFEHPRLPSPSPTDIATLRERNPAFLRELRARANDGRGDFDPVILQAFIEPGSVDMDTLFHRLMALKFTWRGHEQGKPLALAYDWLYPQWTEIQRAELREKLVDGCDYLIKVIRNDRLSPYNVILYNSPFQALMACSIALYRDDPRGEPVMRFTYDLWKNRVLPVWRQIMGKNGGWHEGGEYVGIGIGQAIYELPAMWRSATGEDLIASEPGIRGFLDFLVYRTQPDGTHYRWGDGAWFDKIVPDAAPLALELHDAAAYSLRPPAKDIVPTGWPWGPLNDPTLFDPTASARLPLTKFFDGIGMIVARSDWSPDATYVTFKAGDNYWSHVHLDQGAFTIYKGGALAIDSGLYGPVYGSDHHMNYDYQTIAHNTITVTDPDDTVPAPGKKQPRPIANDGGQRRIGSGWGVEAAPLDLAEWEAKRDIYHTGTMEQVLDQDGLTVGVADITPAYTNRESGHGTFSARTRRVERFWRTFGYDRVDDVVVVFDQVTSTRASFRKRWLLHTLEKPSISADGFTTQVAPEARPGRAGGTLTAKVLLPRGAVINAVGGPGLQFFVDNKNYDENGTLEAKIRKLGPNNGQPGAWRVEVSPPQDEKSDVFLVVLLPTLGDTAPTHRVRLLESGSRVGCEIIGPHRSTQWWFDPGHDGVEIRVLDGGASRTFILQGRPHRPLAPVGWLEHLREWLQ